VKKKWLKVAVNRAASVCTNSVQERCFIQIFWSCKPGGGCRLVQWTVLFMWETERALLLNSLFQLSLWSAQGTRRVSRVRFYVLTEVKPITSVCSRPLLHESTREKPLGSRVAIKIFAKAAVVRFFPRCYREELRETSKYGDHLKMLRGSKEHKPHFVGTAKICVYR